MGSYSYIVIDDESLIRKGIIQKINATLLDIHLAGEAEDGEEALQLLRKADPDIILLDMKLPVLDGKLLLKTIRNAYPQKKVIIISGFSDFEYTKCAIENNVIGYLLKPFNRDEIKHLLEKAIQLLEQEKLDQTKIDYIIQEKEQYQKNLYLQQLVNAISNPFNEATIAQINAGMLEQMKASGSFLLMIVASQIPIPKIKLMNLLQQHDAEAHYLYIPIQFDPKGHLLLFYLNDKLESDIQTLPEVVRKLFQILSAQSEAESELYFGLSTVKDHLNQLHEAYVECRHAIESRKLLAKKEMLNFSGKYPQFVTFHWENQEYLLFFIESGNSVQVTKYVVELFDILQKDLEMTFQNIKDICNTLLSDTLTLVKNQSIDVDNETFFDIHQVSSGLIGFTQLQELFLENCLRITEGFKQKNYYASHSLIDNIQKYVQLNYNKKLSLEKISNLFFVNSSYCSYIFKEKTGENLSDYINKIRIENAKKLLKNNLYNITKVAKVVGYNNVSYFFRIFKNSTGLTPWEYKKSVQSNLIK
jgi:two-component system, response regulator YesN